MVAGAGVRQPDEHKDDEAQAQELRKYAKEVLILVIQNAQEIGMKPPEVGFVLATMIAMFHKAFGRPGRTRDNLVDVIADHLKLEGIE